MKQTNNAMNLFLYDGTFEGFLSAIFYSYEYKTKPYMITCKQNFQDKLFLTKYTVITMPEQAERVWKGILKKTSKSTCQEIYRVFLSETEGVEMILFNYISLIFDSLERIESDYSNDIVLLIKKLHKKVIREAQRVLMFVRFQKTADNIYYAPFEPLYNVLPLTINHFTDRFADQKWMVYDMKRDYGFFYDLKETNEIKISTQGTISPSGKIRTEILSNEELFFQDLWRKYYDSINIKERKNLKVHMHFMPKRYWKFLPEKDVLNR